MVIFGQLLFYNIVSMHCLCSLCRLLPRYFLFILTRIPKPESTCDVKKQSSILKAEVKKANKSLKKFKLDFDIIHKLRSMVWTTGK